MTRALGRRRQWHIQTWLRWMMLGCLLPTVAIAAFLTAYSYAHRHADLEQNTIATARALMQAIDRDLIGAQAVLATLASSPHLARHELAEFHAEAMAWLPEQQFSGLALSDTGGQQLVSTLMPFGAHLPRHGNPALLRRVIETGQPAIADLLAGGTFRQAAIAIEVPVPVDGKPAYGLSGALPPGRLAELLGRQQLSPGWVAAVFDASGTIVARSRNASQYVGKQASAPLQQRLAEADEGVLDGVSQDGTRVLASFSRSPLTGWAIVIGIPTAELTADLYASLWRGIAVAGALVLFGLFWARLISGRISRAIEALQAPALALAADQRPAMPLSRLIEVSKVGTALIRASHLLEQRAAARASAEAGLHNAMHDLTERGAELRRTNAALERFAYGAAHDLKSPLGAIEHLADWIREDVGPAASAGTVADLVLVRQRVARLRTLVDEQFTDACLSHGTPAMEQVDTAAVVHDILAALAPPAGFTITCVDPMPVIRTQRAPLERVLAALIGNAVQHHDGAQGHITVAARCNAGLAEFRVTDDGPGIGLPPPDRPEADGIGLAIVRRTVGSHGGEIRVETAPPARGTSIVFTWKEAAA